MKNVHPCPTQQNTSVYFVEHRVFREKNSMFDNEQGGSLLNDAARCCETELAKCVVRYMCFAV